jgi:hypothetical protein
MKKLIVILFFLLCGSLAAQEVRTVITNDVVTADKYYWIKCDQNYAWRMFVTWTGNTGTTSSVVPVTKTLAADSVSAYVGMTADTLATPSGFTSFVDKSGQLDRYLGLYANMQGSTSSTITIYLIQSPK